MYLVLFYVAFALGPHEATSATGLANNDAGTPEKVVQLEDIFQVFSRDDHENEVQEDDMGEAKVDSLIEEITNRIGKLELLTRENDRETFDKLVGLRRTKREACNCEDTLRNVLMSSGTVNPANVDPNCYTDPKGIDYRGTMSVTRNNVTCQKWNLQTPHSHEFRPSQYVTAGIGDHNYCRNPDSAARPWCFTMDPETRSEYCNVGDPSDECATSSNYTLTGTTYIRFGVDSCNGEAQLVYKGFIGGNLASDEGGGSNFLCLPFDPIYDVAMPGVQDTRAYVYHTQYMDGTGPLDTLANGDAPCAVCRVATRSTVLMIPARNDCPDTSWTMEYSGYLATQSVDLDRHSKEFICLDSNSIAIPGTDADIPGAHLYGVESRCQADTSMPCDSGYVNGWELTCAVCTK